jgi:uncharacterized protein (DUF885 family)
MLGGRGAAAQGAGKAAALNALYGVFADENFRATPEFATNLGVDVGPLAYLKHRVSDVSLEGVADAKALNLSQLNRLKGEGRQGLTGLDAVNYDAVLFGLQVTADADAQFDYGGSGAGSPYVLSQLTGAYQSFPTFLDTQHSISTAEDADAYLDRLQGFAGMLDQETEVARHDAGLGMVPPDFILDKTIAQLNALLVAPGASILVSSIKRRAGEAKLAGGFAAMAEGVYAQAVRPALQRQIAQVRAMRSQAVHAAGIGSRRSGEAYYAAGLKAYTTSSMPPAEVHRLGLEQTRQYQADIDAILKAQGMSQGSVGERLAALSKDPRHLYPDTDAGKAQLIAHLNALVAAITPRLPRMFRDPPTVPLEIRRVPPYIEAGPRWAITIRRRWMAQGRRSTTSTWATPPTGRAGFCRRSPSTKARRAIICRFPRRSTSTACRCCAKRPVIRATPRAGGSTPSNWRTNWACTRLIRSPASAI